MIPGQQLLHCAWCLKRTIVRFYVERDGSGNSLFKMDVKRAPWWR